MPKSTPAHFCKNCDHPIRPAAGEICPKCQEPARARAVLGLMEVDIAHSGQTWEKAREQLLRATQLAVLTGHSGLKVIHGRGEATGLGTIKEMALAYLTALARTHQGTVAADKGNPGASILWLSKS